MFIKFRFSTSLLIISILLVACSNNQTQESTSIITPISPEELAYPGYFPYEGNLEYPAPVTTENADKFHPDYLVIPTPSPENGVITGKILIENSNEPYLNSLLVLGDVSEPDAEGYPPLVGYSVDSDPKAIQSSDGVFVFDNIKPGEYGIVLWSPISTFLLTDHNTGDTIFVTVKAGEVTNIGTHYVK